jgi:hypothetical protein
MRRRSAGVGDELVEETGLALVEALGVEGVGQPEILVVEVVTQLVEERAHERPEGDDPPLASRAHPELDSGRAAAASPTPGRVEALQLAPAPVGARAQDLDATGWSAEGAGEAGEELLGRLLYRGPILRRQGCREGLGQRMERRWARQSKAGDLVALPVDPLLGAGQPLVIRKPHA